MVFLFLDSQEMKAGNKDEEIDLDQVLLKFGFGPYQLFVCVLMGFVVMFSNVSPLSYVFTASDLKYRYKHYILVSLFSKSFFGSLINFVLDTLKTLFLH